LHINAEGVNRFLAKYGQMVIELTLVNRQPIARLESALRTN